MNLRSESQPGGRKSRSSFAATPDRWENSRSSAASLASSAATGGRKSPVRKRNAFKAFLRALVSFFSSSSFKPEITSPRPRTTRTLESPYGMLCLLVWTFGSFFPSDYMVQVDFLQRRNGNKLFTDHFAATPSRLSLTSSRESRKGTNHGRDSPWQRETGSTQFTMEEILKATKNFSPSLKIGQGGFGTVYKATLDDGTPIAVKRGKKSMYDNHLGVEFQSEINILGQIEHLSLVRFFGYLEDNDERVVVTEYVPNGTLREHLDGFRGNCLELSARLDIAVDVAHAVTYLHMYADHPIIHRDIKSSNILLTENLRAKVADFGFARFGISEAGVTHISTQVKGTAGYLDPEYLRTYQLTDKSDVYSFGVLLVELISSRRPIERKRELKERITIKWALKNFRQGKTIQVLDPNIPHTPANNLALEKILELAFHCLAPSRQNRPSMRSCAEILWNIRKDYRELLSSDLLSLTSHQRNPSISGDET
ncbi:tyrosine protein kinase domain containing protein [Musa troglodytarum]|uniref:non-specific serine/threonine protein kinase n=1 Tax=Musa troglodytarum TaxID=320322 RepID=A0A9E7JN32_9LILI|nr:tyrosine protein kinase domain containing protein [Musa troglodytarum]